ncbi:MAG TPA: NTP transferase domain-containing protein [Gaiellaceae bacterium]|jgi:2-phospho-L-lactate guanylyltransferase|nr:NTP transferase domain-containing protein [Gaiellaceae bacterium]
MAAIVVPYRGASGKQRLGPLPDGARTALSLAMLADVLAACTVVGETVVVTSDDEGARVASEFEALLEEDPGGGQGAAVEAALRRLRNGRTLVVNADLPCVIPEDLRALESATPDRGLAFVAARDGTTNALGLSSPSVFAPLYGPGSAERFRMHAHTIGVEFVPAGIPNLADDVDSLEDLERVEFRIGPRTLAAHTG